MKRALAGAAVALLAGPALAADIPADVAVDTGTRNKTIWPKPVPDSGQVKWEQHRRDLSKWPTLSYDDKRPTPKPQRVALGGAVNGDPARGKQIAMNTQQGNCWACHALPGDPQPGTSGPSLLGFKARKYSDAHVYQQIYDARVNNPYTVMPPYGTFGNLTEQEIRDLTAFLQSIE